MELHTVRTDKLRVSNVGLGEFCLRRFRVGKAGVVEKSGAWYAYKGEKIGQGRENAKIYLEKNPKVAEEIEKIIRDQAAAITKELEGNPKPEDKISEKNDSDKDK